MDLPDRPPELILFLGIDDFSFRRGCRFGTILVNLESRRPVDLLPDREAKTSAAWMRQQLDLMVVSRDRVGCARRRSAGDAVRRQVSLTEKSERGFRGTSGAPSGYSAETSDTSNGG